MKKLFLLLITLITFTNVSYAQSAFSVDAGLTTEYGATLIAINYEVPLTENVSWQATLGFPSYSTGFTNNLKNNRLTIVINDSYARDWRLRIAYSKEKSISEKLILVYGVRLILAEFSYGTRIYSDENGYELPEVTGWKTTNFINTVGSTDVLDFLPFPFVSVRYFIN
jgi:hypothetical protein